MIDYRYVRGKKTMAFSGLGDNDSFFKLLEDIGADLVGTVEFPDHHSYSRKDLSRLASWHDAEILVTTEKDAVKIERMELEDNIFYLSIEAQIEDEESLIDLVLSKAGA
jgi:tetraacyldisaccharide 4'-kinase